MCRRQREHELRIREAEKKRAASVDGRLSFDDDDDWLHFQKINPEVRFTSCYHAHINLHDKAAAFSAIHDKKRTNEFYSDDKLKAYRETWTRSK